MLEERTMFKVSYYRDVSHTMVDFKFFKDYDAASNFASDKSDRIIEIKSMSLPAHYPDADLDLL